jgi:lysophospholipase L1-like esterase
VSAARKIVGLGDSTTAGTPGFLSPLEAPPAGRGNEESQYSYWMMRIHPEWRVVNKGVNGQRSDQIMARFERDVSGESPEAVVVLAGVNDIFQGRDSTSVERNLQEIYSRAKGLGIAVVAATILPYNIAGRRENESMHEVNLWIESAAAREGLGFCDTRRVVSRPENQDMLGSTPDGLHPSVEGYRRMGEALTAVLEKVLK